MKAGLLRTGVAIAAMGLLASACSAGSDSAGGGASGTITISGSSTVQPITNLAAELFNGSNPDVSISVDGPGTSDGFVLFCSGETDINDASRQIAPEEAAACKKNGVDLVELEIALDGITVMTDPSNTAVNCLTKADLYALMGPQSQGFANWSDANSLARTLGGAGNFPDLPLQITAPGEESGTYGAFLDLAGFEDLGVSQGLPADEAKTMSPDYQASPNDNVIIQAMEGSPGALGYVGFAYADQAGEQVHEIGIDGGSGCVLPSQETIADGSYPLSRSLYIYVSKTKLADSPALGDFVDFYLTDEGLKTAVSEADYIQLSEDRIDATRSVWKEQVAA